MNKIDLIIEAIRLAEYHVIAKDWGDDADLELYTEALAAARELQALKPVAYWWESANKKHYSLSRSKPASGSTPLYAIDGEQA